VRDVNELDFEGPELDDVARLDLSQIGVLDQLVLAKLVLDEPEREAAAVDGCRNLRKDVRQRSHVVFVPVGEEESEHLLFPLRQVGHVRQDQVDAEHLFFREHQPRVDHDDLLVVFERHHVAADLAQPADWDDAEPELLSRH